MPLALRLAVEACLQPDCLILLKSHVHVLVAKSMTRRCFLLCLNWASIVIISSYTLRCEVDKVLAESLMSVVRVKIKSTCKPNFKACEIQCSTSLTVVQKDPILVVQYLSGSASTSPFMNFLHIGVISNIRIPGPCMSSVSKGSEGKFVFAGSQT